METPLLDLPISFFEYDLRRGTFANIPSQQTTLRRIVSTKYYQPIVDAIRAETDKDKQEIGKKQLPCITPVALLNHRKKDTSFEERIINQWPMATGDIDRKDNPDVDMAELKQHIARLPFVLLCAYSVRKGLWFVVRLPDNQTPDTLAAHFRYLQRLFSEKLGIKLDSTKGSNPTALRFVSCDSEPYFNDEASIMEGTYIPPEPKAAPIDFDALVDEDSNQLLRRLVKPVQTAGEGQRHETLLKAARLAGGFIAANRLDEQDAVLALETVASEWPMFSKSQKTIRDGIHYGLSAPVYPEVRHERPVDWKVSTRRPKPVAEPSTSPATERPLAWRPYDYQPQRIDVIVPDEVCTAQPSEEATAQPAPFKLPALIEHYWSLFERPPFHWNKIASHRALLRRLANDASQNEPRIVTTIEEQYAYPGSILRPDESQVERFGECPAADYPPVIDQPSPLDAVPIIRKPTFFEWQRSPGSPFRYLGLNSLPKTISI